MLPHNNRTPATGNSQSSGAPLPLRIRSSVPSGTTRRMSSGPSRNMTSSNLNGSRQSVEREMENIFRGSDLHDHPPLVPENTPTAPIMGMGLTSEDVSIVDRVRQQEPRRFRQIPMEPLLESTRQQGLTIDDRRVFDGVFLNPSRASGSSGSASQPLAQYSNATSSLFAQRASRSRPRPNSSSDSSMAANGDSMTSNSQSKSTVTNGATRASSRLGKSASMALGSSGDPGAIHKAYTGSL
ncbi:hypothetical protein B0J14DRAFT_698257 [Halenospora varia]|nr:hypothetical protein B0J14DRAFT_698257 [Halenospora varia]